MKYFYDLHIHTALSPCADILMSPNNILNMASLKGLDIIGISDHNSCLQIKAIDALTSSYNMLVVYGVEVSVAEGFHVLCLFKNLNSINIFQEYLDKHLKKIIHQENEFNEQIIFDEFDNISDKYSLELHQIMDINLFMLRQVINKLDGLMILAHIERYEKTIIEKVKNEYKDLFDAIEINVEAINALEYIKQLPNITILRNSDSHSITSISERTYALELNELSIDELFKTIKGANND